MTISTQIKKMILIGLMSLVLTACGSGGGGEDDTTTPTSRSGDNEVPVITLIGSETINVNVGDTWTDPGAEAYDNVDGNITSSIEVSGTPDLTLVGTYIIRYRVADSSGNTFAIIRTVIVGWDSTAPVDTEITVLTIYTQKLNDYYAGDALTRISFLFDYANISLENSNVSMKYSVSTTYLDNGEYMVSTTLSNNLSEIDNIGTPVIGTIRDDTSSDLIYGFNYNETNEWTAGLAYLPSLNATDPTKLSDRYCTGVMYGESASNTLIHEFGHSTGLDHDIITDPIPSSLERYGRGYGVDGDFVTIMSYAVNYNVVDYSPRYSSTSYTCGDNGLDCGIDIGLTNEADARSALIKWKDEVAAYR